MFCILVYDINEKRVAKMLKLCRQYLSWIQNSVFEGDLTEGQIGELLNKIKSIINRNEDSVILYTLQNSKFLEKEIIGVDKSDLTSNFI